MLLQFSSLETGVTYVVSVRSLRYAPSGVLVGGTRHSHFDGTNLKPRKLLENVHAVPTGCSPTTRAPMLFGDRVHAVLGAGLFKSLTIKLHHCLYAHWST